MTNNNPGLPASEWSKLFATAGILQDKPAFAKQGASRNTAIGKFLSRNSGRAVPVEVDGRTGTARLRSTPGRSRKVRYWFEVQWDAENSTAPNTIQPPATATQLTEVPGLESQVTDTANADCPTLECVETEELAALNPPTADDRLVAANPEGNQEKW